MAMPGSDAGAATPTCGGRPATHIGTPGDDVLVGTNGDDVMVGRGGNDVLRGRGGDDALCGGRGDDILSGGPGDDVLRGGRGHDDLRGGAGGDNLVGNEGDDLLRGGADADILRGGRGLDICRGRDQRARCRPGRRDRFDPAFGTTATQASAATGGWRVRDAHLLAASGLFAQRAVLADHRFERLRDTGPRRPAAPTTRHVLVGGPEMGSHRFTGSSLRLAGR